MGCKRRFISLYHLLNRNFKNQTGFSFEDTSFENVVTYLYKPTDPSSLAVSRMLFGLLMALDVPEERGGAALDLRWGDPRRCHFPLLSYLGPLPLPYMAIVYAFMFIGALGVMLGFKYRSSATLFALSYWYIFLLEKSFWNNHSYLFGLVAILLIGTSANHYLSFDAYFNPQIKNKAVPYWNYFILKYQLFILYFVAGLKKCSAEWLSGYAMKNLSQHWVFNPITMFLSVELTDFLVVHWFAFVFDLSVCFWMIWRPTRVPAMLLCASFHFMNSRLFSIGMFPWVCLATLPLFCPFDWPKQLSAILGENINIIHCQLRCLLKSKQTEAVDCIAEKYELEVDNGKSDVGNISDNQSNDFTETKKHVNQTIAEDKPLKDSYCDDTRSEVTDNDQKYRSTFKQRCVVCLLFVYAALQAFLPYSHFITKGYNNWTNGLYGYSWDMMVNSWDTILIVVKVTDNEKQKDYYLDPEAWVPNDRWSKHGDMVYQYSRCISRNIDTDLNKKGQKNCAFNPTTTKNGKFHYKLYEPLDYVSEKSRLLKPNISIYIDVWCSMNGRFQQRMFNPTIDLLASSWTPFEPVPWLMPLMTSYTDWRRRLLEIQDHVFSWNNYTDVLFIADFPGMFLQHYITEDLQNVTLTVLDGQVDLEDQYSTMPTSTSECLNRVHSKISASSSKCSARRVHLRSGQSYRIVPGMFHKVHTVGSRPACYMYTFVNATKQAVDNESERLNHKKKEKTMKHNSLKYRIHNIYTFLKLVTDSLMYIFFRLPLQIRVNI